MNTVSKISTGQLFSLLLLTRLLSTLTFMPIFSGEIRTSDCIVAVAIGAAIIPVFCLPLYFMYRKGTDRGIVDMAYSVSPVFSKIISVLYVLLFLFYAFTTLARTNLFVGTVVFPDMDTGYFIFLTIVAACYAASLGLEPLGRAGTVSLVLFCLSFLVIFLTLTDKVNLNNLSPVFYDGAGSVMKLSWSVVVRTIELAVLAVIVPRASGNKKKGFVIWYISFFVIVVLIFFYLMTTVGEFSLLQMYPVQSMAVLSEFSVLERLDVLLTGVWIISAFIKTGFMIYLSTNLLQTSFKREWKNIYIVAIGVILSVLVILVSTSIISFPVTTAISIRAWVFIAFVLVLPSVVLVCDKISKRKQK